MRRVYPTVAIATRRLHLPLYFVGKRSEKEESLPRRRALVLAYAILFLLVVLLVPGAQSAPAAAASKSEIARQIKFGAEMAKQGNWREAIFRWQRVLSLAPDNPRIHNNLAVAYESLGEYDKAEAEYRVALASPEAHDEIKENHELFLKFYNRYKEGTGQPQEGSSLKSKEADAKEP